MSYRYIYYKFSRDIIFYKCSIEHKGTKMKTTILSLATILALGLTGCGGGTNDTGTTTSANMVVKNADGTTFGVTRAEDEIVNGGVPIYDVGTGEQIGFIQVDGSTNNQGGVSLGTCGGAIDDNGDFTAECTLETTTHNNGIATDTSNDSNTSDGGTAPDTFTGGGDAPIADLSNGNGGTPTSGDGSGGIDPSANLGI
jgi:hypothetical protein